MVEICQTCETEPGLVVPDETETKVINGFTCEACPSCGNVLRNYDADVSTTIGL